MPSAEIVGGGIAGLVAAVVLARRGWSVRVHERSPTLRASGNGITIFENGLRILEAIEPDEDASAYGYVLDRWIIYHNTGEIAVEHDPYESTGGRITMFARQAIIDFLAKSARAAGVEIVLGSKVVSAEREGAVLLEDGTRLTADLVIGADGIHSVVRRSVAGNLPLGEHRKVAIRMLIPTEDKDFPGGNNRIGREYNHPNGRRVGILPVSPTVSYMIVAALKDDIAAHAVPIDPKLWAESFPTIGTFFERAGDMGHCDVYYSISPPSWHFGRCALIGDAAHGMTPALGQGACSSMMTAYALASSDFESGPLEAVLGQWEKRIRPLIDFTQEYHAGITAGRLDPKNEIFFSAPELRSLLNTDVPGWFKKSA